MPPFGSAGKLQPIRREEEGKLTQHKISVRSGWGRVGCPRKGGGGLVGGGVVIVTVWNGFKFLR